MQESRKVRLQLTFLPPDVSGVLPVKKEREREREKQLKWTVAVMSWQHWFQMCLKVLRKVLFEKGPYWGKIAKANSLVNPPKWETSHMTGEGPTLEVLHTFCRTQETSANAKKAMDARLYIHTHTYTHFQWQVWLSDTLSDENWG